MDCGNRISPIKIVRNSKKEWQTLGLGGLQERKKQNCRIHGLGLHSKHKKIISWPLAPEVGGR